MRASAILQAQAPIPAQPGALPQAALPGGTPANLANADLGALQARAAELTQRLAGLHVQRDAISRQISRASGVEREALLTQRVPTDVQIAQGEAELENIRAQIASRSRVPMEQVTEAGQIVIPSRPIRNRGPDPDVMMGMTFTLLLAIVIPSSIAFARRIWRGTPKPAAPLRDDLSPRFDRLEQAVDAIAIEIERISEGQRFMTRVMAERPAERSDRQASDAAASALAEGQPMLALGAGPAEPVVMQNRQSVRQSITPH